MTGKRYECRKVDLDFFTDAEIVIVSEVTLACSSESLFRCFEDAGAWPEWVSVIEKAEWSSPKPFKAGTTRNVEMPGGMIAYEEFLAWDAPRHMAFRFNQFSQKFLKAFGEDYKVTDLGDNRCRLVWTVGIEQSGMAGVISPLLKPFVAWNLKRISRSLAQFMENEGRRFCTP